MYAGVPLIAPSSSVWPTPPGSGSAARPKSSTTTRPSGVTKAVLGLMSRAAAGRVDRRDRVDQLDEPDVQARKIDRTLGPRPKVERLSVDELHAEEVAIGVREQLVQLHEVWMRQIGDRPELALEAVDGGAAHGRQRFDRDHHVLAGVVRGVDDAHPARADTTSHHEAAVT